MLSHTKLATGAAVLALMGLASADGPASGADMVAGVSVPAAAEPHLANIRQLTFGGENAEAYFAFDGDRLIYQATPRGAGCDQIFTMKLDGSDVRQVSTGEGRTTCSYYYPSGDKILYSSTHHFSAALRASYSAGTLFAPGPGPPQPLPPQHTASGGLLATNGSVYFTGGSGQPVEVYGGVESGPGGSVVGSDGVTVVGDSGSRLTPVELPPVTVPAIAMAPPVRHEGLLPMLVSPGSSGYERIEVAADAELVLRGPATVVIGTLVLEPGAALTLDTRDGNVVLYVTGGMDLRSGSSVTTSSLPCHPLGRITRRCAPTLTGWLPES